MAFNTSKPICLSNYLGGAYVRQLGFLNEPV